ncbi:MAG: hypothetical protein IKB83_01525, partial [Mycoplasmataceae bacterium]|nr:hypothetical protein [Mycoplasmataceae bacterium]
VDLTNAIYGFTNPKDPAKDQSIKNINHHAKTFKDHKALDNHFKELAIDGLIKNRDELISYIENELNGIVEITRKGKDYLGLKLPNDKKATRYKGEIYQNGNYADIFREENERKQSRAREISSSRDGENIKRLELKLIELIDKKSEFNRKRYQKRSLDTTLATDTNNLSAIDNNQYNSVFLASEANADTERLDQRWRYNNDPTEQDRNKSDRPSDISNDHKGLNDEFIRTAFNGIAERKSRFNSSNKGARESIHKSWKAIRDAEKRKSELAERKSELERTIREQTQLRNSYFQKLTFERIQASFNKFNDRIQRIKERFAKQQHTRALLQEFDDRIREIGAKIEQKLKDKSKITKKDSQKRQRQFSR